MAGLIRTHDWAGTALGPLAGWPQSLRTTVSLMLHSPIPMVLLWGPEGVMTYNDAYTVFARGRHPRLLGSKVLEGWPEVADFNANVMRVGMAGGTLSYRDQELTLYRNGVAEQVWMNLDYSPVIDESGRPGGVLAIVVETTEAMRARTALHEEKVRLQRLFEKAPGFICVLRGPEHVFEFVNDTHRRLFGSHDWIGKSVREAFPDLAGQGFYEMLDRVYATGERIVAHGAPARFRTSPEAPERERLLDFIYEPIRDEAGAVTGIFCEGHDVTEAHLAEAALRASEARFRTISDALPGFAWTAGGDGLLDFVSQRWTEYSGAGPEESCGANWLTFVHPDDAPHAAETWAHALASGSPYEVEFRLRGRDGAYRWWLARALPVLEAGSGTPAGGVRWIGTCTDIHERKQAQERQFLLLRELNHRVKNLFAVAGGMVALTARYARTPQEMAGTLQGRLDALARANDLIHPGLDGAENSQEATTLDALVRAVLLPYVDAPRLDGRECIVLDGPAVPVGGSAVTSLALTLHETATNAAKYGALSTPEGCIRVEWAAKDTNLLLRWEETGGPAIAGPPVGRGFGSSLVRRSIVGQLQGGVDHDWLPDGLTIRVTVPLDRLGR